MLAQIAKAHVGRLHAREHHVPARYNVIERIHRNVGDNVHVLYQSTLIKGDSYGKSLYEFATFVVAFHRRVIDERIQDEIGQKVIGSPF